MRAYLPHLLLREHHRSTLSSVRLRSRKVNAGEARKRSQLGKFAIFIMRDDGRVIAEGYPSTVGPELLSEFLCRAQEEVNEVNSRERARAHCPEDPRIISSEVLAIEASSSRGRAIISIVLLLRRAAAFARGNEWHSKAERANNLRRARRSGLELVSADQCMHYTCLIHRPADEDITHGSANPTRPDTRTLV